MKRLLKNIIKLQNDKFTDGIIKIVTTIQRTIPSKSLSTKENYYNFLIEAFRDSFLYDINLNVFSLNVIIINFDIETTGISEEEFIQLIKSMVK